LPAVVGNQSGRVARLGYATPHDTSRQRELPMRCPSLSTSAQSHAGNAALAPGLHQFRDPTKQTHGYGVTSVACAIPGAACQTTSDRLLTVWTFGESSKSSEPSVSGELNVPCGAAIAISAVLVGVCG